VLLGLSTTVHENFVRIEVFQYGNEPSKRERWDRGRTERKKGEKGEGRRIRRMKKK
jgi:hypothetical protein